MPIRLFLLAAVVLIVFGIIAAAQASGQLFGTIASIWFMASFLAFLTDMVFGGWAVNVGQPRQPQ